MKNSEKTELINYLSSFISDKRKARFNEIISNRTSHLRIVLENVYQAHNASAVLRSCESFGIQYVHFIENKNHLKISKDVDLGSSNWLTIKRHNSSDNNTIEAINHLKKLGYRIVATSPHKKDCTIDKLPVEKKLALIFGTELDGVSQEVLDMADEFVEVPMFGFTESFNVSVCAGICIYELTKRMLNAQNNYLLTDQEKLDVYFEWMKTTVDKSKSLIENFLKNKL